MPRLLLIYYERAVNKETRIVPILAINEVRLIRLRMLLVLVSHRQFFCFPRYFLNEQIFSHYIDSLHYKVDYFDSTNLTLKHGFEFLNGFFQNVFSVNWL